MLLFVNATILDCTGADPHYPGWLLVDGNIIREIGYSAVTPHFSNTIVIDCKGLTLMPGLIDAHTHASSYQNNSVEKSRTYYLGMRYMKAFRVLEDTLFQGFTTVRDCGGVDAGFREAIKCGLAIGPRMTVCNHILTMTGGHSDHRLSVENREPIMDPLEGVVCDGIDEVRKMAREQLRCGADHVKLMTGGGCSSEADEPDSAQFSLGEIKAAVEEADAAGKDTIGHCYSNRSMTLCANAGVYSIEHGNFLDQQTADLIKSKGCWFVPTLSTYHILSRKGDEMGFPSYFVRKMKYVADHASEALDIAFKTGLKIGSGSDLVGNCQPFKAMELELKAKIIGPMEALLSMTKSNAALLKNNKVGTLEPEKYADILLINGDVLKDPTVIQNRDNIFIIMKDGKIFKRTDV